MLLAIVVLISAALVGTSDKAQLKGDTKQPVGPAPQPNTTTHTFTNESVDADKLPAGVTSQPIQQQSLFPPLLFLAFDDKTDLARRDSLKFDHSDLIVGPVGAHRVINIAVNTLTLSNGARVITNGNTLAIRAVHVYISSGSFTSFDAKDAVAPATSALNTQGLPGEGGGKLILAVFEPVSSAIKIDLFGQKGGKGGPGTAGPPMVRAPSGESASDSAFSCGHGGGNGTAGKKGNTGGTGATGGPGGNGGASILQSPSTKNLSIDFSAPGGAGGDGGEGGPGRPGQPGGKGGAGSHFCGGGNDALDGDAGDPGAKGQPGQPGAEGKQVAQ